MDEPVYVIQQVGHMFVTYAQRGEVGAVEPRRRLSLARNGGAQGAMDRSESKQQVIDSQFRADHVGLILGRK